MSLPGGRFSASKTLSRNCARLHHTGPRTELARTHTHYCETNGQQLSFRVSESSLVGHQTRQSMSDANRRLSAVQGERKRHILLPITTVSSPRQPRRALSQGPVKGRNRGHLSSDLGCGNSSEPSPQCPCTTVGDNEARGITGYDQPALYGGVCVQGVEKRQDTRSACTIIGALHTHIVCGVASALACGVGAHLCQSVQILCVPALGPINSLNCETVRKSPRAVCFPRPHVCRMFACLPSQHLIAETTTHRFAGIW